MEHLSSLDASFLHLETAEMPMHVGALQLLELAPARHAGFIDVLKRHVADRMHLAAVYTRKLAPMPLDIANPVWVHDDDIDLDYHIRQVSLPRPGTRAQLEAYVGRLHSSLLDRSRPLWEFTLLTGLDSGQLGFYTKIHHAALDGQGALLLAQSLLDTTAVPRAATAPPRHDGPFEPPGAAGMLKAALRDTVSQCVRLARGVPTGVRAAVAVLAAAREGDPDQGQRDQWRARLQSAPRTALNVSITSQRTFATATLSQNEVMAVAQAFGVTLNEAVLATMSGALRRYLDGHGGLPDRPLVAAVPVTMREAGNIDMNNQVGMMFVRLASDRDELVDRVKGVSQASARMKKNAASLKSVMPTGLPSLGLPWLMSAMAALYGRARLADSLPPIANLIVSNVRGPAVPMFLAGARMATSYPVSIVTHGLALNVTMQSYNGALDIGMVACRRAVPDIQVFASCVVAAHEELLAAAWQMRTPPVTKTPARKRAAKATAEPAAAPAKKRKPRAAPAS